jgi:hypothetical protein
MVSPFASEVLEDMQEVREEGLTPEQFTAIRQVLTRDCDRLGRAEHLFFVIGNYDEERGQKERVLATRDRISAHHPDTEAFLLEDVDPADEAWESWYVKFRVFLRRADTVVAVFEDNDGGHELEAGEVDNAMLYVLKRDYYDADGTRDWDLEYERFDGMLVKLFDFLERRGQLYRWGLGEGADGRSDVDSLAAATEQLVDDRMAAKDGPVEE